MNQSSNNKQLTIKNWYTRYFSLLAIIASLFLIKSAYAVADKNTHIIEIKAVKMTSGQLAYQMMSHTIDSGRSVWDVTQRYNPEPTIPGPTLVFNEGDKAEITLHHAIEDATDPVSIHVHGVHYKIDSDGTLKALNHHVDSAAFPGQSYTYKWDIAAGTAGTWPYHDHTFGNAMVGAEDKGLFGAVIVNPDDGEISAFIDGDFTDVGTDDIAREFVLWMHETTFWGMEVNNLLGGKQVPLWTNPTVGARLGEKVRFHIIGMGTAFHTFHLHGHRWQAPGSLNVIDTANIGPIYRHSFVVEAGEGVGPGHWHYHCHVVQHMQSGMMGRFLVIE